jgi:hypothetical protein
LVYWVPTCLRSALAESRARRAIEVCLKRIRALDVARASHTQRGRGADRGDQGQPVRAPWVGVAAAELKPIYLRIKELLLGSTKIAVDETRAPVLDPLISTGCAMQSAGKLIGGKGVIIGAYNVALMVQSRMLSGNTGVSADATAKESAANIIPGDVRVPGW